MSSPIHNQDPAFFTAERWLKLWRNLGAQSVPDFARIRDCYAEPHRHHHGTGHIDACLSTFDSCRHLAGQPNLVELALWLHDAVYDVHAHDNEARSAQLARQWLDAAGLGPYAETVATMIMATCHAVPAQADDVGLVVDIDLAVLALSDDAYQAYAQAVRQEYAWVADDAYRAGRRKVLNSLLATPRLYAHPELRAQWERTARRNMHAELRHLKHSANPTHGGKLS